MKRFIVVGLGNFGASAARELHRMGHEVIALDADPQKVEAAAQHLRHVVAGDGTDPAVLEGLGARSCDAAIVSTGDDIPASVLTAIGLRDHGVREIHVKVVSEVHARILDKIGVTGTIFPEQESAKLLAKHVANVSILKYFELGPEFSAQEMAVPESWVGRSLRELALPKTFNVSVVAVRDYLTDRMEPIPNPDAPLKDSETLLVAGRGKDLERVARTK
jgi:trk system potassium uptake protein TrkA